MNEKELNQLGQFIHEYEPVIALCRAMNAHIKFKLLDSSLYFALSDDEIADNFYLTIFKVSISELEKQAPHADYKDISHAAKDYLVWQMACFMCEEYKTQKNADYEKIALNDMRYNWLKTTDKLKLFNDNMDKVLDNMMVKEAMKL